MKYLTIFLLLTLSACAVAQAGPTPNANQRIAALEAQIAEIQKIFFGVDASGKIVTSAPGIPGYALDGAQRGAEAKAAVDELRERVWPLFAQGADRNHAMINCYQKTCP